MNADDTRPGRSADETIIVRTPAELLAHAGVAGEARPRIDTDPLSDDGFRASIYIDHLAELGFLALQIGRLFSAPGVGWQRLSDDEDRLDAHVDALELGGEAALRCARALWASEDEAEIAAVAWLLAHANGGIHAAEVHRQWCAAPPDLVAAFEPAWCRTPHATVVPLLVDTLTHERADLRVAAARSLAFRPDGEMPGHFRIRDTDADVVIARASLAAAHGDGAVREELETLALDAHAGVGAAALQALSRISPSAARNVARGMFGDSRAPIDMAAMILGTTGRDRDLPLLLSLRDRPEWAPTACEALGWHGHAQVIPALIEMIESGSDVAAHAASALARVMGTSFKSSRKEWGEKRAQLDARQRWRNGEPWRADRAVEWLAGPDGDAADRGWAMLELRARMDCPESLDPHWPTRWQFEALDRMRSWVKRLPTQIPARA